MSFQLVKEAVLNIPCDAVVHFIPVADLVEKTFHSSEIAEQAGPGLAKYFDGWDDLAHNRPVVTVAYKLPHCYYIVHTAGIDASSSLLEQISRIQTSLEAALALSKECKFQSVAIPLLGFSASNPQYSFYRVFVKIIQKFLSTLNDEDEMTVFLSVPENIIDRVSNSVHDSVTQYVEENYIDLDVYDSSDLVAPYNKIQAHVSDGDLLMAAPEAAHLDAVSYTVPFEYSEVPPIDFAESTEKSDSYEDQDKSFIEMVDWWIDRKGLSMKTFYLQSNLNRAMLSKLRCHPEQLPKKSNALACAIGLQLTMEETQDLIGRAGFSFSKYVKSDVIVEYFIKKSIYDIFLINEELFAQDLSLLGTG